MTHEENPLGDLYHALKDTSPPKTPEGRDPHLCAVEAAALQFAEAMAAAAAAGKRVVVRFEHRAPRRTRVVNGKERTWQSTTNHYINAGELSAEAELVTDDDV
jgi:hypothetical protein